MKKLTILVTLIALTSILFSLQTIYVDITSPTWGEGTLASPFQQIYTAITCMNPNEEVKIVVYPGDYNAIAITGRTQNLTIESRYGETNNPSYINATMIHGMSGINGNSSAIKVLNCTNTSTAISLTGFTLKNSGGTIVSINGHNEQRGGGVFCQNAENVIIDHCNITANTATKGGGIALLRGSSLITNCNIYNNIAAYSGIYAGSGGGIFIEEGTHTIKDSKIYENSAPGGLAGAFELNHLPNNNSNHYNVSVESCLVYNNSSSFCAVYAADTFNFMGPENVLFKMTNCTIAHNHIDTTNGDGFGIQFDHHPGGLGGQAIFTNCIIFHNQDNQHNDLPIQIATNGAFGTSEGYPITFTYCDIANTVPGVITGTIHDDPLFVNLQNYNFSLAWQATQKSPCIDTGEPTVFDVDGTPSDIGTIPAITHIYETYLMPGAQQKWIKWLCFPVLDRITNSSTINENFFAPIKYIDILDWVKYKPFGSPDIHVMYIDGPILYSGVEIANSIQGYKVQLRNTVINDIPINSSGSLQSPDTIVNLMGGGEENWIGYFCKDSAEAIKAISTIADNVTQIKTQYWCMDRNPDGTWNGLKSQILNYGDFVQLICHEDCSFRWNNEQPVDPKEVKLPERFVYDEKEDYVPLYITLDSGEGDILPKEIGLYVDDVCKGAVIVEDSIPQICAYLDEGQEITSENAELVMYYESKSAPGERRTCKISDGTLKYVQGFSSYYTLSFSDFATNPPIPTVVTLQQNYPNPFNPSTTIEYNTQKAGNTSLQIFNVKGQLVKSLWNGWQAEGIHKLQWDGSNEYALFVSSGIYFVRLKTSNQETTRKLMLLK